MGVDFYSENSHFTHQVVTLRQLSTLFKSLVKLIRLPSIPATFSSVISSFYFCATVFAYDIWNFPPFVTIALQPFIITWFLRLVKRFNV